MIEWIISSSVLILVIIALRGLLRGRLSLRLQYALWGIVLLRLLLPFSLFDSGISVMNAAENISSVRIVRTAEEIGSPLSGIEELEYEPYIYLTPAPDSDIFITSSTGTVNGYYGADSDRSFPTTIMTNTTEEEFQLLEMAVALRDILIPLWLAGAALMLGFFVFCNLRFGARLRRSRRELDAPGSIIPVYVSSAVETPCLFGFFRPAVYVTPDCAASEQTMRHVLAHETTHYRHGDNLWSALRCLALALHWYDPLVWYAAVLSRRDAELACDEGVLRRLGDDERGDYGRTLIGLSCAHGGLGSLSLTATTMTGSKKSLKERVTLIAKRPKMAAYTLVAVILVAAAAVGCTFSGAAKELTDADLMEMAYEDAQSVAFTHSVEISSNGVLRHEGDDVKIYLPVTSPSEKSADHIKVVYTMLDENGEKTREPYSTSVEYVSCYDNNFPETVIVDEGVGEGIDDNIVFAAKNCVIGAQKRYNATGTQILEARLSGLERIATGTISESGTGFEMYRIEFRLLPEDPGSVVLAGGMKIEDGWITEADWPGIYLICYFHNGNFAGITRSLSELELQEKYERPEMIEKYGNKYTAACMEEFTDLVGTPVENVTPTDLPIAMVGTNAPVDCYLHMRSAMTWTGNGWIHADGKPLADILREENISKIPTEHYSPSLCYYGGYGRLSPLRVYDENLEPVYDNEFEEGRTGTKALRWLSPGTYYCVFGASGPKDYVEAVGEYASIYYDAVFRLVVDESYKAEAFTPLSGKKYSSMSYFPADGSMHICKDAGTIAEVSSILETAVDVGYVNANVYSNAIYLNDGDSDTVICLSEDRSTLFYSDGRCWQLSEKNMTRLKEIVNSLRGYFYFTGDSESLVGLYAREIYAKKLLAVEGDYAITDYKAVSWDVCSERVDGAQIVGEMNYAISPVNNKLPDWWAGSGMDEGEGEYEGMWICSRQFVLTQRGEGIWECTEIGTGGAGGWGFVPNLSSDEAADALLNFALEGSEDAEFVMPYLPLLDWYDVIERELIDIDFIHILKDACIGKERIYGPEEWRTWADAYPNDQLYRNLYLMKFALKLDGAFYVRMEYVINELYNYDENLFEYCLEFFNSEERDILRSMADDQFQ